MIFHGEVRHNVTGPDPLGWGGARLDKIRQDKARFCAIGHGAMRRDAVVRDATRQGKWPDKARRGST